MRISFQPTSKILALFMFLPITPSIAAITVFTQSVISDRNQDVLIIHEHSIRMINATSN